MCKRVPFFSSEWKVLTRGGTISYQLRGFSVLRFYTQGSLFRFFLRSNHKFTWLPRWVFVSLLSNLSIPLLSGCDVASAEGVYTHVAQNSWLMQTSGDKSKYEHFIKIPPWSLNLESPKSASRERSQPILEQHASCFGFDRFSLCNHRHWGGGLDSRVYWKDISSSLLTQWRGKQQNGAQQESRLSRERHTHSCCDTF